MKIEVEIKGGNIVLWVSGASDPLFLDSEAARRWAKVLETAAKACDDLEAAAQ